MSQPIETSPGFGWQACVGGPVQMTHHVDITQCIGDPALGA